MVYLDNHTETTPCGPAVEQMRSAMDGSWIGSLDVPYQKIYDLVGADPKSRFVFTSSGAEAINQVHWTAFVEIARKEGKCHFITAASEDAATIQSLKRLEELGCFVKVAPLDADGRIDVAKLSEMIGPRTGMISISWAQGLTGVIQPIEEIAALAKEKGVLLHVDATYALGKVYCNFADSMIDYLTFAGDRIHSVKSSGGIFVKPGRPIASLILGQPFDTASFLALSAAASQAALSQDLMSLEVARLRDALEEGLKRLDVKPLYTNSLRLPNVSAMLFPRVHSEALFYMLKKKGVAACIGGHSAPHIHRILPGLDELTVQTAVSFSLSRYTTQKEIDQAIAIISEAVAALRPLAEDLFA